jgi:hypothetical protein
MLRVQTDNLHSWKSLFRTTRASLGVLVVAALGLALPAQTADELVALSNMTFVSVSGVTVPGVFVLQFALGFLALSAWYWARAALAARFGVDDTLEARAGLAPSSKAAFDAVPRLVFLAGVLLGAFLVWRGFTWPHAAAVAVWAVPAYLLIRWRLALTNPRCRSHHVNLTVLRSRRHVGQWLRVLYPRLRALLLLAPFGPYVSVPLFAVGVLVFLWGAAEGFVPWSQLLGGEQYPGLPALAASVFPGPSVALVGFALMIGPLTALVFLTDGLRIEGVFLGRRVGLSRPPVLGALILWSVVAPLLFSLHTVRVMAASRRVIPVDRRVSLDALFAQWVTACAPDTARPIRPIVVAISGGASRAGIWGAQVLSAVEAASATENTGIFAVSSVSGGSLGAAAYMAVKQATPACGTGAGRPLVDMLGRLDNEHLGGDALGPLLAGALLSDTPRALFAPIAAVVRLAAGAAPRGGDRAEALERAFERLWHEDVSQAGLARQGIAEFSAGFLSLFYLPGAAPGMAGAVKPGMPIWIVNGTDMTSGGRMLTAPFASGGTWPFRASSDVLGLLGADVPISTAINNSARFPYLEPSGELSAVEDGAMQMRHGRPELLDGGYFDNEGLQTALELADWMRRQGTAMGRVVQPVIVQATANADIDVAVQTTVVRCPDRPVDVPTDLPASPHTLQLLAPVVGLYNVRGAHAAVLLRQVRDQYCGAEAERSFFHFYLFNSPDRDIPLNWLLSPAIVAAIRGQLTVGGSGTAAGGGAGAGANGNDSEAAALYALLHGTRAAAR